MTFSYSEAIALRGHKREIGTEFKIDASSRTSHTSSSSHSHTNIHPVPLPATGLSLLLLFVYLFIKRK